MDDPEFTCPHGITEETALAAQSAGRFDQSRWPEIARWAAGRWARKPDTGLGDTAERMFGTGGRLFKAAFKAMGRDCGCGDRQRWLNTRYPLRWP